MRAFLLAFAVLAASALTLTNPTSEASCTAAGPYAVEHPITGPTIYVAQGTSGMACVEGADASACISEGLPSRSVCVGDAPTQLGLAFRNACLVLASRNVHCFGGYQPEAYTGGNALAAEPTYQRGVCILQTSRNVHCYGSEPYYLPPDYTSGNVSAVVPYGYNQACVLLVDRGVDCYGGGSPQSPGDYYGHDATQVAVTTDAACAVLTSKNVRCWGWLAPANYLGGNAVSVGVYWPGFDATHKATMCALLTTRNVHCWGTATAPSYSGGDAVEMSVHMGNLCVLRTNGNVHCVPNGEYSAGDYTGGNAIAIEADFETTCALLSDRSVQCWGAYSPGSHLTVG